MYLPPRAVSHIYFDISGKHIHLANSPEIHHTRSHLYTQVEISIPNTVIWLFPLVQFIIQYI